MDRLLKLLQSNQAVLVAAIMSLSTQLWHSVKAFVMLDVGGAENHWNYLFGILFSMSTSLAILLFTVRGRKNLAYFFLTVEVFINVIHYGVMGMELGPILYSTIFICIIVPVTIAVYSSEIDVDEKSPAKNLNFIDQINELIGFDISNPHDKSGHISEEKKSALRKLWKERHTIQEEEMKSKIKSILKEGSPLFK